MLTTDQLVDVHTHILPQVYLERLRALAPGDEGLVKASNYVDRVVPTQFPPECGQWLFGPVSGRIPAMDAAGIAVQTLGAGSLLAYPSETPHHAELVSTWNDAAHAEAMTVPGRFRVFATLPLPDVSASIHEIHRVIERSTTAGFGLTTHVRGVPLTDEVWFPLFDELDAIGATVFIHPDGFCVQGLFDRELDIDVGTQFDDTLVAVNLYRKGLLTRFPNITWVVSHLGGALSFLLERLDEHWERDRHRRELRDAPSRSLGGLVVDTAGHGPKAISFAAHTLGPDRMAFGTDFPMVNADSLGRTAAHLRHALNEEQLRQLQATSNRVLME